MTVNALSTGFYSADFSSGSLGLYDGSPAMMASAGLISALMQSLAAEAPAVAQPIWFETGRQWGASLINTVDQLVQAERGAPLSSLPFEEGAAYLQRWLPGAGYGAMAIETTGYGKGVVAVRLVNSLFVAAAGHAAEPVCHLYAGLFSACFSAMAGRELDCLELECQSMGASECLFIIATPKKAGGLRERIAAGEDRHAIAESLRAGGG
ncbi:MAG: hypothetical protein GMKNLPBB_03163 [Myxococcota bacterium]|nr:hypothetical protein [Myxococcota bacterium]